MITVTATMEVAITPKELGHALMRHVMALCEIGDDAGLDWYSIDDITMMGSYEISTNPNIARLVDAANILLGNIGIMPHD